MKKLGIWAIAIAGAFVIGVFSANPVVDAAGGWKAAIAGHETRITDLENQPAESVNTYVRIQTGSPPIQTAFCDEGDVVLSGGFNFGGGVSITFSTPVDSNGNIITDEQTTPAGWGVGIPGGGPSMTTYVVCAIDDTT